MILLVFNIVLINSRDNTNRHETKHKHDYTTRVPDVLTISKQHNLKRHKYPPHHTTSTGSIRIWQLAFKRPLGPLFLLSLLNLTMAVSVEAGTAVILTLSPPPLTAANFRRRFPKSLRQSSLFSGVSLTIRSPNFRNITVSQRSSQVL